jgi:hypothetical protein
MLRNRVLYPVLGMELLDRQVRRLESNLHVYGHSHVNRQVVIDGVAYCNNALGYPQERQMTQRRLLCVHQA